MSSRPIGNGPVTSCPRRQLRAVAIVRSGGDEVCRPDAADHRAVVTARPAVGLRDLRGAGRLVVADLDDAIESLAHGLDVRDDDDLLEAVAEAAEQLDHVLPPRLV